MAKREFVIYARSFKEDSLGAMRLLILSLLDRTSEVFQKGGAEVEIRHKYYPYEGKKFGWWVITFRLEVGEDYIEMLKRFVQLAFKDEFSTTDEEGRATTPKIRFEEPGK